MGPECATAQYQAPRPDVGEGQKRKPVMIEDYNRCKGGVDNLDKVVGTYACRRRANRWSLALFHNLLDVSLYNAFVLWTWLDPSWQEHKTCKRRLFIREVGEQLVTAHIQRRERLPRASTAADLVMELQGVSKLRILGIRGNITNNMPSRTGSLTNPHEFREFILEAHPKLRQEGGFELVEISGTTRSRQLILISCPNEGYHVRHLKDPQTQISHATIFIRPLQRNLNLEPACLQDCQAGCRSELVGPPQKCVTCGHEFPFSYIKAHSDECIRNAS
uniref:uncharacterized protein LOC109971293 n=1 Tax=Monopterus albus TaxID=43700 RepID=UPI0009B2E9B7|nr:uncharacterized protein LOC109971293 [Monopterus albus]